MPIIINASSISKDRACHIGSIGEKRSDIYKAKYANKKKRKKTNISKNYRHNNNF